MVSGSLATLRFQRNSISRLYIEVMEFQSSDISCLKKNVAPVGKPFEEIILENINFRYPGLPNNALKNISLKVTSGESIGFIGASASGKTTLVDLMLGLLTPAVGRIIYNGQNIDVVIDEWRSHVAYLPQQVFLIDNTLRRNIALGYLDDDIDDGRIKESLEQARLTSLVNQLPQGLDTELGERGVRLSGGQRQISEMSL
jgi:ATP-binding cassette subfamily C protein